MAEHNLTGNMGEAMAANYFLEKGYSILHRNWRHVHWEIDIIAEKETVLHFIEVKTKRTRRFGYPEEKVNKKKMQNLMDAAEAYLHQYPGWKRIQFNILSITILPNQPVEYFFIEDVYI